ncbi:MAG: ABC transporter ATP-binding protein [Candidatus Aenigmarchaeota archaeon]|nr:ABC transporter ATP-binding protein [Candidatus Aenigmarchaeota archaeon]
MNAIEVNNVSKKFRTDGKEFYALKDVSLHVKDNEVLGLLGPNGSGKTTLMNIIIGLLTPDGGNVKLLGRDTSKFPEMTEKVGLVSTDARFHWALSVKDVFTFYGMVYGLKKRGREKRTSELVNFFGLEKLVNRRVDGLSTGERMRLSFAKALLNRPRILLLDEPTLGLDPHISIKLRREIKHINREFGTPMLLTSHYMSEVQQLANRVSFILQGRIMDTRKVRGQDLEKYFVKMVRRGSDED